ncbi:hypothetical protein E3N88_34103 [Mikania micrantha]|uniref:Uncharacterized protein n=1 Tax=Mikania micrantha TaxID=192012 RepID=A0A5N6MDQ5_9ASTR|nr:hypothetical protein E3N88_34103 [Mikania micrantha]
MAQVSMVNKVSIIEAVSGAVLTTSTLSAQGPAPSPKPERPPPHREEITKNHSARSELPDRSAQLGKPLKPDHSKQHSQRDRPSALSITRDEQTTVFGIPSPGPNPDTGR